MIRSISSSFEVTLNNGFVAGEKLPGWCYCADSFATAAAIVVVAGNVIVVVDGVVADVRFIVFAAVMHTYSYELWDSSLR